MKKIFQLIFFVLLGTSSYADVILENSERGIRQEAKARFEGILQTFDPGARVDIEVKAVKIRAKREVVQSTPFLLAPTNDQTEEDKIVISKMSVTIYSQQKQTSFPAEILANLEKLAKSYDKKAAMNFIHIQVPVVSTNWKSEVLALSIFEKSLVLMMCLSFFAFVFFKVLTLKKFQQSGASADIGKIISENMNNLRGTIETLAFHKSNFDNDFAKKSTPLSFEINAGNDSFYKDFNLESLEEVMMDCYWAQEDDYAAFVWSKLDILRKGQLISKNHRLGEYAKHLSNLTGVDKKFIQESYYFHPFSLGEISNSGLTEIVKQYNSLFHLLPRLRIQTLGLLATEKKRILLKKYSKRDTEIELANIKWENYKTAEVRSFDSQYTFEFESLEEEERFFSDGRMDFELVKSFPSLMWLSFLEKNQVEQILTKYSAKELAIAWIAPKSILEKLKKDIPESKVKLLESYLSQIVPSKKSAVYLSIVDEAASMLKSQRKTA